MPIAPMLATLARAPFHAPGWVYEEKYDGIRAIGYRRGSRARLVSRNGKDLTAQFPAIARAIEELPGGALVLDGEIVALDARGVSRFQLLQRRAAGEPTTIVYAVFDCLEAGGRSLVKKPLRERRAALERIVPAKNGPLQRSRRLASDGHAAYAKACREGWEGILAKDEASAYEPGRRTPSWLKVKCRRESEFVVGGFTAPAGKRSDFGALLVGLFDGDRLRFTGKVGTGFAAATLASLGAKLRATTTTRCPFDPPPRVARATWVRPVLVAELAFAEWTNDGKLRQPVFLGLRNDKAPRECTWAAREP
ncbi:MAG TPA: non-homologous end-joining DNA ligase [Polyangiaceae bacterium]